MQIPWLERDHSLVHRRIVFSALPPVRREKGLSQACFARALFCLEGSASGLIKSTGPTSSYHHLRGWNFSTWMTPEGPAHAQYRNRGTHTCPFPGRAQCMHSAGAKWGPTAIWGIFICQWFLSVSSILKIYFHISHLLSPHLSPFSFMQTALLCFSNKNLNFVFT